MVADDQGNEVKRIIYDSFGNVLVDTNEQFHLPLGFASGLNDQDTGLVHFGFREYDPEVGRFTAQDPLGYGGGDVDVYGYCLDDPINFNDGLGLEAGGIGPIEFPPRKYNVLKWYIWKANEGACEACKKLDGNVSETPTMERPHPNCLCQQIECTEWDEFTEWEDVRELETINITMFPPIIIKGLPVPDVKWRKDYRAEEQRVKRHYASCGNYGRGSSETTESRVNRKDMYRYSKAYKINTGYGIETGDRGWTHNPWTGETVWFFFG
ncbi:RHS repeat-associated core domain-containing protein [Maridesulfovibrio sp.]|uniref:RHS repeat domain-containing protein n=1 Tax=Maridesulfovibrio sp. TaxID=2795000 RepID=UPI0029CA9BD3|nr:RHS repeat-associated core domain-containing protein [Maridesulfovibrio sp.]